MTIGAIFLLFTVATGFTIPQSKLKPTRRLGTGIATALARNVTENFDYNREILNDSVDGRTLMEDVALSRSESDLGKEIFLSNVQVNAELAETESFEVVQSIDGVNESLQSFLESNDNLEATSMQLVEPNSAEEGRKDVFAQKDSLNIEKIYDTDVEAVLAASEEAVAAIEANMSGQVSAREESRVAPEAENEMSEISQTSLKKIEAPSAGMILKFAVPAIGVWLCSPLLSLIDTSAVGMLSGTTQQAALNPAVSVTDYAALLIAFLYTGTTNLIAAARESDDGEEGSPRTKKAFIGALKLSGFVGFSLGTVLILFARSLLRALIGNDAINPSVFDAAMKYVRIRAIGMPAAAVIGSAQAASLGMRDIKSPLYVLGAAALVNLMGDLIFVGHGHPWIGGTAGAAWATVFSQYAAMGFFVHWLCNKPKETVLNLSSAVLELTGRPSTKGEVRRKRFRDTIMGSTQRNTTGEEPDNLKKSSAKSNKESPSVRGFLSNSFRGRDLLKFPSKATMKDYAEYVVPVTSTQFGRVSGYVAMSHVVSSSLGTFSMAAQQVIVSLFYCLCPIADSLSLTGQSFLPSLAEKKPSEARTVALRKTNLNFMKAGAVFGLAMVAAVCSIPLFSSLFTSDQAVVSLVNKVVPLLAGFFAVHGFVCGAEGILLGRKDLKFLGSMYAGFCFVVPYFMLRVKRAALSGLRSIDLTSVWKVFLSYQLVRFFAWVARVSMLQRRTERESRNLFQA